jgi:hypothetical protein
MSCNELGSLVVSLVLSCCFGDPLFLGFMDSRYLFLIWALVLGLLIEYFI